MNIKKILRYLVAFAAGFIGGALMIQLAARLLIRKDGSTVFVQSGSDQDYFGGFITVLFALGVVFFATFIACFVAVSKLLKRWAQPRQ